MTSATTAADARGPAPDAPRPPPRLPGYRDLELIGQGRSGTVWKAVAEASERTVAIKVVAITKAIDAARFLREAEALASLQHPNIVTHIAAGREGNLLYLVMEYLPGGDVGRLIQRAQPAEQTAVRIAADVAAGLEALERAGFIHRDIAPGNILLDNVGVAKIGDFGLVRTQHASRLTQTGEMLGTPAYTSPEQVRGAAKVDVRSDIYALGAILYALVTGVPPFTGHSVWSVMEQVEHAPRPDPRDASPTLSNQVRAIIRCAMALAPADRYQSPGEMHEDLVAVQRGGVPSNAGRRRQRAMADALPAQPERPRPALTSRNLVLWLLATMVLGLGLGAVSARSSSADARAAREARAQPGGAGWQAYLAAFPGGQAAGEAHSVVALSERRQALVQAQQELAQLRGQLDDLAVPSTERTTEPLPSPTATPLLLTQKPTATVDAPAAKAAEVAAPAAPPAPLPPPARSTAAVRLPAAATPPAAGITAPAPPAPALPDPAQPDLIRRVMIPHARFLGGVACSPHDPQVLIAWDLSGSAWRSDDTGATWQQAEMAEHAYAHPAPQCGWDWRGQTIFLASLKPALGVISDDGGKSFRAVPPPWPPPADAETEARTGVTMVVSALSDLGGLFVGWSDRSRRNGDCTLSYSADQGRTWKVLQPALPALGTMIPIGGSVLLLHSLQSGMEEQVSIDLGASWAPFVGAGQVYPGVPGPPRSRSGDNLYLLSNTLPPAICTIGGQGRIIAVRQIDDRFSARVPMAITQGFVVDPLNSRIIYLANAKLGVLRSLDGGATWMGCSVPLYGRQSVGLSLTAAPHPLLVFHDPQEVVVLDDHLHHQALFDMPLDAVYERFAHMVPR